MVAFSGEYQFLSPIETQGEHRIVDDGGHVYAFDPAEWDYDDHAEGWNGEEWADDWDD